MTKDTALAVGGREVSGDAASLAHALSRRQRSRPGSAWYLSGYLAGDHQGIGPVRDFAGLVVVLTRAPMAAVAPCAPTAPGVLWWCLPIRTQKKSAIPA